MSPKKSTLILFSALCVALLSACGGENPDDDSFNVFSTDQDIALGKQMRDEVLNSPFEYEVWSRDDHKEAYALLDSVSAEILGSGKVFYRDKFPWELYIIHDDETANAFCAPGGYIFVYTGLMKYVHNTDELAGVLAHEIAHADRRHSTDQLTKEVGVSIILGLIFGNDGSVIGDMASSLFSLNYSRKNEKEADAYGVGYLCETRFAADASKHFFERIDKEEGARVPTFVSTHPNPGSRVEALEKKAAELGCGDKTEALGEDPRLHRLFLGDRE